MRIYKLTNSILIENNNQFFKVDGSDWDSFINDDELHAKASRTIASLTPISNAQDLLATQLDAPMSRQEESKSAGGADFYGRVYEAERPELFFKATRNRTVGSGGLVRIRKDSTWDVPEPELVLVMSSSGKIIGYSIGNDMSS